MKIIGLDIGTTTVSAVVTENDRVLDSLTLPNGSFIPTENPWEKAQNPDYILRTSLQAVDTLLEKHPDTARVGVTGQMHGIVYLDKMGQPLSPLYTWQDGRGDLPCADGKSYARFLSEATGYSLATGYGMVTHYYNIKNALVPENAVVFCTIHDYVAMVLAGRSTPLTDVSDAASFGLFNVEQGCFDLGAVTATGIDSTMLPKIAKEPCIGSYRSIPVYVAVGDNQASFLGATAGNLDSMLVNVGTGSQFSVYSEKYLSCPGLETRPFPGGGYLLVGASLCGGRAYALLESFFRELIKAAIGEVPGDCYALMESLLSNGEKPVDLPKISTLFQGTRQEPELRAEISLLSTENFSPRHMTWAMLEGMAGELHDMYLAYLEAGGKSATLIGSGNGLRRNLHLQGCFSELFGQQLVMSSCNEEAAAGAAFYAAMN